MANLNLPNEREGGDIRFRIGLEDNGVAVDWSGLEDIRVFLYADAQKQVSGECSIEVDAEDNTVLACLYSGDDPQFRGINSVLVRAKYQGEIKVYDKPAINIVARTADADGVLVIDDPVVPVQINVEEVSTSLLNNAIDAALRAAADAEHAAHLIPNQVLLDCEAATQAALDAAGKAPYINDTNNHWMVWSPTANAYVDSGKVSKGDTGNGIASWSVVESQEDDGNNVVTVTFTDGTSETFNVKNGKTGNGIASIVQTTESPDDAGTNVITVTMTNGQTMTFNVKNGSKGTPGVARAAYKSVDTLPTASAETMDKIYLTPSGTSGVYNMSYTEFDGSAYTWESLGTTAIQLSDYATKAEVSQLELKVGELSPETKPIVVGNWVSGTYVTTNNVGKYSADGKRIICDIDLNGKEGNPFSVIMSNGSQVSIRFVSVSQFANPTDIDGIDANEILLATGWTGTADFTIPTGTKSAIIVMKNSGGTTIDTSASSDASFSITSAPSLSEKVEELSGEISSINAPSTVLFDIENWVNGTYVTTNNLGTYNASTTRIIGTVGISGMDGELFAVTTESGYDASIRFLSVPQFADPTQISGVTQEQLLLSTGWINTSNVTIPSGTRSAVIVLRKHDDSTVDTTIASNASFTVTLDGLKSRVDALEAEVTGARKEITGYYSGERLYLGTKTKLPFLRKDWKTIGIPSYAQSLAIYGDYIVFFYGTANATGSLWSISNGTKICDLTFSYGALGRPHGNVICFGTEFAEGNTELPLLYVSQWDNEGGCLVYNISTDGDTWSCELVQTIMVDNMDADIYGSALGDWVVDKDANAIYSVKYRIASSSTKTGNALHFCKFTLPKLSDGPSVVFSDTDIIDSFTTGMVQTTQDKKIHEGVLFFSAGNTSNNKQKICAVSLTRKSIISVINLEGYGNEPEGIDIIDEGLVLGYGFSPTKFYLISDVL